MIHIIKESFDICLYNVTVFASTEIISQILNGIFGTAFRAISITVFLKICFNLKNAVAPAMTLNPA